MHSSGLSGRPDPQGQNLVVTNAVLKVDLLLRQGRVTGILQSAGQRWGFRAYRDKRMKSGLLRAGPPDALAHLLPEKR